MKLVFCTSNLSLFLIAIESGADTTFLTDSTLSYDDNDPRMRSESSTSITPRGATASNPGNILCNIVLVAS